MMNPFRESADPGIDKTAVRLAQVREEAETKRKLIEERESTRRAKVPGDDARSGRYFLAGVLGVTFAVTIPFGAYEIVDRVVATRADQIACKDEYPNDNGCPHLGQRITIGPTGKVICACEKVPTAAPSSSVPPPP